MMGVRGRQRLPWPRQRDSPTVPCHDFRTDKEDITFSAAIHTITLGATFHQRCLIQVLINGRSFATFKGSRKSCRTRRISEHRRESEHSALADASFAASARVHGCVREEGPA